MKQILLKLFKNFSHPTFLTAAVVTAAFFVCGCAAQKKETAQKEEPATYYQTLNSVTRGQKVYENLETRLYVYATYKSLRFRRAYIDEYTKRYQMSEELKTILMGREMEEEARYNEFLMSAYTPADEWNDFDRKNSVWKLYLTDKSGERVEAVEIKKADNKDTVLREFFPFMDPWSQTYIVRFPKYAAKSATPMGGEESGFLTLIVTGIKGSGELTWPLIKEDVPQPSLK